MEYGTHCLFVYGLVAAGGGTESDAALLRSLAAVPGVEPEGPPEVLRVGRIGALVSRVPVAEFSGPRFEASLADVAWLEPRVRAHAAVNAVAFAQQPVLPMRFGTLFSSADRLAEALLPCEEALLAELDASRGLEEWTVRICANPDALIAAMAANAQVAAEHGGAGAQYLLRRRLALKGRPEMAARLINKVEEGHAALAPLALRVALPRTEVSGLAGGQRSLLSRTYVVRQAEREAFLTAVERQRESLGAEGFTILNSGPWPPVRPGVLEQEA